MSSKPKVLEAKRRLLSPLIECAQGSRLHFADIVKEIEGRLQERRLSDVHYNPDIFWSVVEDKRYPGGIQVVAEQTINYEFYKDVIEPLNDTLTVLGIEYARIRHQESVAGTSHLTPYNFEEWLERG